LNIIASEGEPDFFRGRLPFFVRYPEHGRRPLSFNAGRFLRPQGAFGVRQLAAAFENSQLWPLFKDSLGKRQQAAALQRLRPPKTLQH
jgi:hypothetical protein